MSFPVIYYYDFAGDSHSVDDLRELLGSQRYEYCAKMKNKKAGLSSAYAFLLLRYALKKEYGITDIPTFTYNEYGKPSLKEHSGIYFSMSHSGTCVICAVADVPVGADIQEMKDISLRVGKKFLDPTEYEIFSHRSDPKMLSHDLCMTWCVKESYGKMTGKGFGEGFTGFSAEDLLLAEYTVPTLVTERNGYFISVCMMNTDNGNGRENDV